MNKTADPRYTQAVQAYEQALKSMQSQKFERAKVFFEKVIANGPKELVDRALVHLSICNNQLTRTQTNFKTVDEHYDYAISLMNMGDYVGAREHLEEISRKAPNLDFVWYGSGGARLPHRARSRIAPASCRGHSPESPQSLAGAQ